MTKLFAWLFAATLVLGLSAAPTLTFAEDPIEESEEGAGDETMDEGTDDGSDTTDAPAEDPVEGAEEGQ